MRKDSLWSVRHLLDDCNEHKMNAMNSLVEICLSLLTVSMDGGKWKGRKGRNYCIFAFTLDS